MAYKQGRGLITELKKSGFKTSYIKVLIKRLFEFDCFFKLQNVVKVEFISIHRARGGLITGCIFFVYR